MKPDRRTRRSWYAMRDRCRNAANDGFALYGGRGIRMCSRWDSFDVFFQDMGLRPFGMSLGRIDNSGDYEPSNCRWETPKQQGRNTRRVVLINGMTQLEFAASVGLSDTTIARRRARGVRLEAPRGRPGRPRTLERTAPGVSGK